MSEAFDLDLLDLLDESTEADEDRELIARVGLTEFVKLAWPEIERSMGLKWNWHLDAICEHLEAVSRREIRDLVVNVPPGMSKSTIVSVLWPAWQWTFDPGHRWIAASYADRVVLRDAERMRSLVKSDWYRERWPGTVIPSGKAQSDAVTVYRTTAGGMRFSTTLPDGQLTGEHADTMVIDDPIDPKRAISNSGTEIEGVLTWWSGTAQTRFRDHKRSARVCVMQRIHVRDLAGEMEREGAHVLCLPMRYNPQHPKRYEKDPRAEPGASELLDPERVPEESVRKLEVALGPEADAAQLGQLPVQSGGNIVKLEWVQRFWVDPPETGTDTLSIDCSFKDKASNSWVVLQCWRAVDPDHYLLDQERGHWGFVDTIKQIEMFAARWPKAMRKLIEDKANGTGILDVLRSHLPGLVPVLPEGSKEARLHAVSPLFAGNNVVLPHPEQARYLNGRRGAPWVKSVYVPELTQFPKYGSDDQVDATTQYLSRVTNNAVDRLRAAMAAAFGGKRQ